MKTINKKYISSSIQGVAPKKQHVPSIKTIINCHTKPQGLQLSLLSVPNKWEWKGYSPPRDFARDIPL